MKYRNRLILLSLLVVIGLLGYLAVTRCVVLSAGCTRLLFIGNSHTFVNDLPHTFAELARSGGQRVAVDMAAEGGWTLAQHADAAATQAKMKSAAWNFVIVQEQSQLPASESTRTLRMYPAARRLVQQIKAVGATPVLFLAWGRRDGWPEAGLPNYEAMQAQVSYGYLSLAQELRTPVVPVGEAWLLARQRLPRVDLWQTDGMHPTAEGTYLAACVFYAAIFRQSPEGLTYLAQVSPETAQAFQSIAAEVVLKGPQRWNWP